MATTAPLTQVSIANLALSRIGSTQIVTSLFPPDGSQGSIQSSLWYDFCRQDILHEFPWPWARKYGVLNLVQTTPNEAWTYSYRMPSDSLFIRRLTRTPSNVVNGAYNSNINWPTYDRSDVNSAPPPFQVGSDATGQLIFTDLQYASLEYTYDAVDTTQFPVEFTNLLCWRLAVELSHSMANSPEKAAWANKQYENEKWKCAAHAMNEEQNTHPFYTWDSEFTRARFN